MHTGQQRDPRAVPDSGLNSPGLEEETVTITEDETHSRFSASADMATGIVRARGVLVRETLNSLRGTIDLLVSEGHRTVTVDLAEVSCVDQAAVVLFAALQHGLYTHDGELRLTNASTGVRDTLINGQVAYTDAAS
jgi:anti-anti-sigma regulatory factor